MSLIQASPPRFAEGLEPREATAYDLLSKLRRDGGYTVSPTTGETPVLGFAVSVPDFERKHSLERISANDILEGLNDAINAESIWGADRKFYAGAWYDSESDQVYLDVSVVVDDRLSALECARRWKQRAVYDFATGESLYISELVTIA